MHVHYGTLSNPHLSLQCSMSYTTISSKCVNREGFWPVFVFYDKFFQRSISDMTAIQDNRF